MEKITDQSSVISEKQKQLGMNICRLAATMVLVSAVFCVALPGPISVDAALQSSYRIATFNAGANPTAAKIGDLDNDGLNDVAVVNLQGSLQLFFNNGAGSFDRVSLNGLWPSNSNTLDIDIGDLNRDGRNDIAVAFATQRGAVSILVNQGNRTFAAPVNYDVCNSSRGVAIGDLDQDGNNDVADISQCSKAGILLNNRHGSFVFSGTYGNGSYSRSIALADFNRDGFKDIAYVNGGLAYVTVMLNNGNATFGQPAWYYSGDFPNDLTVGDFDNDGNADIAVANSYYSEIFILLNDAGGNFPSYSEIYAGDTPSGIASGDFNGDGRIDLAVTSIGNNKLSVVLNQGNYNFSNPTTFSVGQSPVEVVADKLDGDALPDLVAVNQSSGSITVLFTTAGAPPPPPPPPSPITLTVSTQVTSKARVVDLRWQGATGSSVDVYRNGARITTVPNTGSYADQFNRRSSGTYRYKVCGAGSQVCSNEAMISF